MEQSSALKHSFTVPTQRMGFCLVCFCSAVDGSQDLEDPRQGLHETPFQPLTERGFFFFNRNNLVRDFSSVPVGWDSFGGHISDIHIVVPNNSKFIVIKWQPSDLMIGGYYSISNCIEGSQL